MHSYELEREDETEHTSQEYDFTFVTTRGSFPDEWIAKLKAWGEQGFYVVGVTPSGVVILERKVPQHHSE